MEGQRIGTVAYAAFFSAVVFCLVNPPIIQDNVRAPQQIRRNAHLGQAVILEGIPDHFLILPFLKERSWYREILDCMADIDIREGDNSNDRSSIHQSFEQYVSVL